MTTKINTYLPVFPGFYETIFQPDNEEYEIDEINQQRNEKGLPPIDYDNCEWDYKEYNENVSKEATVAIENALQGILGNGITIEFESLQSPRYYNFSNDSINIEISLNEEAKQKIVSILKENEQKLKPYIKENYTSCDGFISHHSPYYEEWIEAIKTWDNDLLKHKLGAVLDFILQEVEEYDVYELYNDIETHWVYASNYYELIGEQ